MAHRTLVAKVAALIAIAAFVVAIADYEIAINKVPESQLPYAVPGLVQGFQSREHAYGWVATIAILVVIFAALPADPRARRRFFANVGSLGVVVLVICAVMISAAQNSMLGDATAPAWLPAVAMLGAALVGSLWAKDRTAETTKAARPPDSLDADKDSPSVADGTVRPASGEGTTAPRWSSIAQQLPLIGFGFALLTVLLMSIAGSGEPSCSDLNNGIDAPGWTDTVWQVAFLTTAAAFLCGLYALIRRRWIIGLLCVAALPVIVFVAAWGSAFPCGD